MSIVRLPQQKLRYKSKGTKWREENMDTIDFTTSYRNNEMVRMALRQKYIHSDLYDGKITMSDVSATISSAGVLNAYVPRKIQHRPIIRPKIELLLGEATKEPFEWSVMVTDPASISRKQEAKKKLVNDKMMKLLESEYSDEELKTKLQEMALYLKYTWKDLKEVRAAKILKHYEKKLKLPEKFNEAMLDKLLYGEEYLMFDIVGGDVIASKLNPKKVYTLHSSDSNKVSDADIILVEEYWPTGRIIDYYYDSLKSGEIDRLNAGEVGTSDLDRNEDAINMTVDGILMQDMVDVVDENRTDFQSNSALVDSNGNVRVLRAYWRSQKLVYVVKGVDPETGEDYKKTMSEEYVPNPLMGETVEKLWIGEWWQGSKIGNDIYKDVKPRDAQFNTLGNISKGHPGIVGRYNSVSGGKVVSFLSKLKPFQYLYDITWDRLLDALKKDLGNIVEMDMAKKPSGWDTKKWLNYAYKGGIMFVDSFKEATKGAAMGRTAGTYNTTGKTISTSNAAYIQQHINLLEYIKKEIGDIGGITPQREGAIAPSANVGTTERSVMQSTNSTAYEFYTHELFKIESMQVCIEMAKVALRSNKELAQVVLDDFSIEMFDIDGDAFAESTYDVYVTTSKKSREVEKNLEAYAQAFMQNGGSFGVVMDILFSDSPAEKRRKIELAEFDMKQNAQAAAKAEREANEAISQKEQANLEAERELKRYEIDENNRVKLELKNLELNASEVKERHTAGTEAEKMGIEREKIQSSERIAAKNKSTVQ